MCCNALQYRPDQILFHNKQHATIGFAGIQHREVLVYIAILDVHAESTASQRQCMSIIAIKKCNFQHDGCNQTIHA